MFYWNVLALFCIQLTSCVSVCVCCEPFSCFYYLIFFQFTKQQSVFVSVFALLSCFDPHLHSLNQCVIASNVLHKVSAVNFFPIIRQQSENQSVIEGRFSVFSRNASENFAMEEILEKEYLLFDGCYFAVGYIE